MDGKKKRFGSDPQSVAVRPPPLPTTAEKIKGK